MFTGELFRQVTSGMKNLRVLDLCGAPGGKTTHISSILGDNGFLIANEVIRQRSAILAENVTKWGMGNTAVTQNDPVAFASLEDFFDIIIVDAPCSGEGMFHDEVAVREWSAGNAQLCSERQKRILADIWPSLKPGGVLIYSTCTFNGAENEQNIMWLSEATGAEAVRAGIAAFPGITEIEYRGITGYGFHPGRIKGDGFFIAALRKPEGTNPRHIRLRGSDQGVPARISEKINAMTSFDPEKIIFAENRIMAPAASRDINRYMADRLTVVKSGTMIGEMKNETFIPAHDLAMTVKLNKSFWPCYDASWDEAIAFLRLEDLRMPDMPVGRILICYREVPLGFVNNLGKRTNNGYPQSWRIRMAKNDSFVPVI
jgi:NOL1/NOP2/fmu family ribosome biogenesis protein